MSALHEIADLVLGSWSGDDDARIAEHLTFIEDVDLDDRNYSFDLLRLYVRPVDGAVLYATDSGCSCPSPFDGTAVSDLKETNLAGLADTVTRVVNERGYGYSLAVVLGEVSGLRSRLIEAGAK